MSAVSRPSSLLASVRRAAARRLNETHIRAFSNSSRQCKVFPAIAPTSSPQLDAILSDIRQNIILPNIVNGKQRKLIRDKSKKEYLDNEDVRVNIGGNDVRLQHFDALANSMNRRKTFNEALDLSVETNEWQNWPGFLAGIHSAKIRVDSAWQAKFVRKALEAGQLGLVLRLLRDVKNTGLTLRNKEIRQQVISNIRLVALQSDWDEDITRKCLKRAQDVNLMMEKEEHCGEVPMSRTDPRAEPLMISVPLDLACQLLVKHQLGEGVEEMVQKYALRLIAALEQQQTELGQDALWKNSLEDNTLLNKKMLTRQRYLETQNRKMLISRWESVRESLIAARDALSPKWSPTELEKMKAFDDKISARLFEARSQIDKAEPNP